MLLDASGMYFFEVTLEMDGFMLKEVKVIPHRVSTLGYFWLLPKIHKSPPGNEKLTKSYDFSGCLDLLITTYQKMDH